MKKAITAATRKTKRAAAKPKRARPPAGATAADDWRERTLSRVRTVIMKAVPGIIEEVKWRKPSNGMKGVPVWSGAGGMICTGETYKDAVKLTFARGASIEDPLRLFNASLDGNTRRAIDFHEGDVVDEKALAALICAAVELNTARR